MSIDPFADRIREMGAGAPYRPRIEPPRPTSTSTPAQRTCPVCGVEFDAVALTGDARGLKRVYCSNKCQVKAKNAKAWRKNKSKIQRARGVLRPRVKKETR